MARRKGWALGSGSKRQACIQVQKYYDPRAKYAHDSDGQPLPLFQTTGAL